MKPLFRSSAKLIPQQGNEGQFAQDLKQSISGKCLPTPAN